MNILVTGATGNFGRQTIEALLNKGIPAGNIKALVRDPQKVEDLAKRGIEIRQGDYGETVSLEKALLNVDKLLLVSGTDLENRLEQHLNVVSAAKKSGVKHMVYTSFDRKNETETNPLGALAVSHYETDRALKASGMHYTILRNALYLDILPMFLGGQVLETGVFFPAGNGSIPFALRSEMAEAAATVLSETGHENKDYHIAGTRHLTFGDIATMLSDITDKHISYTSPEPAIYAGTLRNAEVPEPIIGMMLGFAEATRLQEFEIDHTDLPGLIGREPVSAEAFLRTVFQTA